MAQLFFESGYGTSRSSCSAFWHIFSWAEVNCSSGLTEPWPVLETNWTRDLAVNSFKTGSDLRFLKILFLGKQIQISLLVEILCLLPFAGWL